VLEGAEAPDRAPRRGRDRFPVEDVPQASHAARCEDVVCVEREHVVRVGRAHSGHAGRRRAGVALVDDLDAVLLDALADIQSRLVRRAVVHDDDLDGRLLPQRGLDGLFEQRPVVEARNDDRDGTQHALLFHPPRLGAARTCGGCDLVRILCRSR
jgi:hypothetical protein